MEACGNFAASGFVGLVATTCGCMGAICLPKQTGFFDLSHRDSAQGNFQRGPFDLE